MDQNTPECKIEWDCSIFFGFEYGRNIYEGQVFWGQCESLKLNEAKNLNVYKSEC